MAGYNPYQTNSYQATQFFPQPQGNVYIINNSMEIANIPVGGGISVALCPSEAIMFLKSMQNGAPTLLAYTLTPCETRANQTSDFHKLFEQEVSKEKEISMETVHKCMWEEAHEALQEWHDKIERKVKSY